LANAANSAGAGGPLRTTGSGGVPRPTPCIRLMCRPPYWPPPVADCPSADDVASVTSRTASGRVRGDIGPPEEMERGHGRSPAYIGRSRRVGVAACDVLLSTPPMFQPGARVF